MQYLAVIETVHLLRVSLETVYSLYRKGDLHVRKFRNAWLVHRDVLHVYTRLWPLIGREEQIAMVFDLRWPTGY